MGSFCLCTSQKPSLSSRNASNTEDKSQDDFCDICSFLLGNCTKLQQTGFVQVIELLCCHMKEWALRFTILWRLPTFYSDMAYLLLLCSMQLSYSFAHRTGEIIYSKAQAGIIRFFFFAQIMFSGVIKGVWSLFCISVSNCHCGCDEQEV